MNKKSILSVLIAFVLGVAGYGSYQTFGAGDTSGAKFNIYGSEAGTTAVTSTSKSMYIGSKNDTLNLNIKTTSTAAQTITFYPEFSNDSDDCSTASYFREAITSASSGAVTVATTTWTVQVPSGPFQQNVQLDGLNTECLKLSFTGSSSTITSMLWIEGIIK